VKGGRFEGRLLEQPLFREAVVPLPAIRVEDPEVCVPSRRPEMVPGDHHLCPLADDVASQPDPRPARELQPKPDRFAKGAGDIRRKTGRLENDQQAARSTRQCRQPMEAIRKTRRFSAGRSRRPGTRVFRSKSSRQIRSKSSRQIDQQQIHGAALEERPRDGQAFVQGLRREDDEPLEPNAAGYRLDRVEAPGEVEVGHDRTAGLRFRRETQCQGRLAARGIAMDRDAGQSGHPARPQDRVQSGKPGGDNAPVIEVGRSLRWPIVERAGRRLEWIRSGLTLERSIERHSRERTDRGRRLRFSREPRSCRTPASPKVRESDGDLGRRDGHRLIIEQMFYQSTRRCVPLRQLRPVAPSCALLRPFAPFRWHPLRPSRGRLPHWPAGPAPLR
jgi:hypothetical protein